MKHVFWVSLLFFSGGQLLAQAEAVTEAKVKAWLKEKQRSFYGERAKDPAIQNLLALYNKLEGTGLLCPGAVVPQVLELQAERTSEETVRIDWKATTAQHVEGYILERSFQKEGPYERVHSLHPGGTSGQVQAYRFTDHNTFEGQSYYRVVQVLATGKQKEQKAVAQGYDAMLNVQAYPNPSAGRFRLSVQSKKTGLVQIRVVDLLGRVVESKANLPANQAIEVGEHYLPGLYIVQVVQGTRTKEIMLQKGSHVGQ